MTKTNKASGGFNPFAHNTATACDTGYEFELLFPVSGDPTGAFITVVGKEGAAFQKFIRDRGNAKLREELALQRRGKEVPAITVEQIERDAIELLIACTVGWRGLVDENGEELAFTHENAAKLYSMRDYRMQVDEAIGDLGNFMKA